MNCGCESGQLETWSLIVRIFLHRIFQTHTSQGQKGWGHKEKWVSRADATNKDKQ